MLISSRCSHKNLFSLRLTRYTPISTLLASNNGLAQYFHQRRSEIPPISKPADDRFTTPPWRSLCRRRRPSPSQSRRRRSSRRRSSGVLLISIPNYLANADLENTKNLERCLSKFVNVFRELVKSFNSGQEVVQNDLYLNVYVHNHKANDVCSCEC